MKEKVEEEEEEGEEAMNEPEVKNIMVQDDTI